MATIKPQDDYQKQGVRIPRDLHERLHEAAKTSGRSYNAELIARLAASFENESQIADLSRMLRVSLSGQDMLASFIVWMHEYLPQKLQKDPQLKIPLRLARGLLDKDGPAVADAFGELFSDDAEVVEGMRRLRDELQHAPHPKKR